MQKNQRRNIISTTIHRCNNHDGLYLLHIDLVGTVGLTLWAGGGPRLLILPLVERSQDEPTAEAVVLDHAQLRHDTSGTGHYTTSTNELVEVKLPAVCMYVYKCECMCQCERACICMCVHMNVGIRIVNELIHSLIMYSFFLEICAVLQTFCYHFLHHRLGLYNTSLKSMDTGIVQLLTL